MEKKLQLVALPTDKSTHLYKIVGDWMYSPVNTSYKEGGYHLYLLYDEEIKKGDWYITIRPDFYISGPNHCNKCTDKEVMYYGDNNPNTTYYTEREFAFKIVATTNPDLQHKVGKVTATYVEGNNLTGIAKIPHSLIEYFVKKQGKVDSVMVEYTVPKMLDGTGHSELRITPSGKILWSPVEEKVYTRDEVAEIIDRYDREFKLDSFAYTKPVKYLPKEWFNKNYPEK